MIGELVMRLFHARTAAHVMHLQTRSFATHKALADFYEGVVDLADSLAETWQGDYGLIAEFPPRYIPYIEPLKLMSDLREWIEEHRAECCDEDDTHLQNIIDEVAALVRQTTYKLKYLK